MITKYYGMLIIEPFPASEISESYKGSVKVKCGSCERKFTVTFQTMWWRCPRCAHFDLGSKVYRATVQQQWKAQKKALAELEKLQEQEATRLNARQKRAAAVQKRYYTGLTRKKYLGFLRWCVETGAVDDLDPRSRTVVVQTVSGASCDAISGRLGLCRERVKQIEKLAIKTLGHDYLESRPWEGPALE